MNCGAALGNRARVGAGGLAEEVPPGDAAQQGQPVCRLDAVRVPPTGRDIGGQGAHPLGVEQAAGGREAGDPLDLVRAALPVVEEAVVPVRRLEALASLVDDH
jgi:hypothetical protein